MKDPEATKDSLVVHLETVHRAYVQRPIERQRWTKAALVELHRGVHQKEAAEPDGPR